MRDEPAATLGVAFASIESQLPSSRKQAKALGVRQFFTGKPCIRGHILKRFTSDGSCFGCREVQVAAYRARNPEKRHVWNMSVSKETRLVYNKRHREKLSSKEKQRLTNRLNREARFGEVWQKKWRAENPDKIRRYRSTRRALKSKAAGSHSAEDIQEIFSAQKGRCAYFGKCRSLIKAGYHVDHIVALSKGGSNFRSNLQLLCQPCNQRKHAKDPLMFAQEIGFLL